MVGESAEFLRVQTQFTRHLDVQIAQVKALLGVRPRVEAGFGLLHDVSFCGQPAAWRATAVSKRLALPYRRQHTTAALALHVHRAQTRVSAASATFTRVKITKLN